VRRRSVSRAVRLSRVLHDQGRQSGRRRAAEDGGFEPGTPDDGSAWKEVSTTTSTSSSSRLSFGFNPKLGDYFAYLSGIASEESTSTKTSWFQGAGWLVVSGYRLFQSTARTTSTRLLWDRLVQLSGQPTW